jgi:hypothetical protein
MVTDESITNNENGERGRLACGVMCLAGHYRKLFGGAPKRAGEAPALPASSSEIPRLRSEGQQWCREFARIVLKP